MADRESGGSARHSRAAALARAARSWKSATARRASTRARIRAWLAEPEALPVLSIALGYLVLAAALVGLTRGTPLIAPGLIMDDTRVVRVEFDVPDEAGTQERRSAARTASPRVYMPDRSTIERVRATLRNLPMALAGVESLEGVSPELGEAFDLSAAALAEIGAVSVSESELERWSARVDALVGSLLERPILSSSVLQSVAAGAERIAVIGADAGAGASPRVVEPSALIPVGDPAGRIDELVRSAGFEGAAAASVAAYLRALPSPTFLVNEERTRELGELRAQAVPIQMLTIAPGQRIYQRGQRLSEDQFALAVREQREFESRRPVLARMLRGLGVVGATLVAVVIIGGYIALFYSGLLKTPPRLGALVGLMLLGLALSCWWAIGYPGLVAIASTAPTVLLVMVTLVAYDRRMALVIGVVQSALVSMALSLGIGSMFVNAVGIGLAVWSLNEIRSRADIVRSAVIVACGIAAATLVIGLVERPMVPGVALELLGDSAWGGVGGFIAGALALVLLPTIERVFDVVTGMTLSELRDPRQPLLRELQQRAPGSYNHSLNVASIAEAAVSAIGGDSLHVYVGALYHDCGKMNKPQYFVENQFGAASRHTKLSPAMSLLVIVGHVKDGIELAKAYRLPKSLHHYIESHHGTTVVEYFYEEAKRQADADEDVDRPAESEYRYPGPKPRTREAAVLMLCDAVESATRAMAEPTPSRIAALVRALSQKRLDDGQFDDSLLTLREVRKVEAAITKAVTAIYHGRIAYPKGEKLDDTRAAGDPERTRMAGSGSGDGEGTRGGERSRSARPA
ncbi:MAG: HD family phosphohydrolase [Phycisphaerales bacterium]